MSEIRCPKCGGKVAAAAVDVAKNVLFCRQCAQELPVVAEGGVPADFALDCPPSGAWHRSTPAGEIVSASCRGWLALIYFLISMMFVGLPFCFLYGMWLHGKTDWWLILFCSVFVFLGINAFGFGVSKLLGRTEAVVTQTSLRLYVGIWGVGWRKTIALAEIAAVFLEQTCAVEAGAQREYRLVFRRKNRTPVKCGTMLHRKRLEYVANALRVLLWQQAGIRFTPRVNLPDSIGDSGGGGDAGGD